MGTYNLTDGNGNLQRIKAASLFQARIALGEINDDNKRYADGGRRLANSWRSTSRAAECIEGGAA